MTPSMTPIKRLNIISRIRFPGNLYITEPGQQAIPIISANTAPAETPINQVLFILYSCTAGLVKKVEGKKKEV